MPVLHICIRRCIRITAMVCLGVARCAFVYKDAFQILKLHPGKGGLKPPLHPPDDQDVWSRAYEP